MSSLRIVPPRFVCQLWPLVAPWLAPALAGSSGLYSLDQLQMMLVRGEHVLLVADGEGDAIVGAATICFENHPAARLAFVSAIGGRLVSSTDLFRQLVRWLLDEGATRIGGVGPAALARLWRQKFDFNSQWFYFERDISHADIAS